MDTFDACVAGTAFHGNWKVFVEEAAASVMGGKPELTQSAALQQSIQKRINDLDAGFLVSL